MASTLIVAGARTPFGALLGSLSSLTAPQLGSKAVAAALQRSGVGADQVSEVILGNVLSGGVGQAPARQAALHAGISQSIPCCTVNKVCGSGMKALMLADQAIRLGEASCIVAGGMESMSHAPHLLPGLRRGCRLGDSEVVDSMIYDGLWDPYSNRHMGSCAELCAQKYAISREQQDAFAVESYRRAQRAQKEGWLAKEMTPVEISTPKSSCVVAEDEGPMQVVWEKVGKLRPCFAKEGSITAANASTINDGAVALVLASSQESERRGYEPIARIVAQAQGSQAPEWFTTAPVLAIREVMKRASWSMDEVDLFEINEAFAVVPLVAQLELGIPSEKLNVFGGAIALGHPIGASGARIVLTLISALQQQGKRRGVAAICIGGGEATALCVELV